MRLRVLLAVVLAFGVLAFLWLRRADALRRDELFLYDHALLSDLHAERVRTIRIDHLERGQQLRLERDRQGTWFLTDPIAYPAQGALVEKLVEILARERGTLEPAPVLAELGLAPPRVVVELELVAEGEPPSTRRVELGAIDLDPSRVVVRVPGHAAAPAGATAAVLRVSRALDNTLERNVDDWRERRLTPLSAGNVRRLVRRGAQPLDARQDDGQWLTHGTGIRLDPSAIGLVVRCAAELRVLAFTADTPAALAGYGLEPPAFELELFDERENPIVLSFGSPPESRRWYAKRADLASVFEVEASDMGLLQRPEETLWDQALVRVLRQRILAVELTSPAGELALERSGETWTVHVGSQLFPADAARADDLIAGLEKARVAAFVPGLEFPAGERSGSFTLLLDDGLRQGAELGPLWADPAKGISGRIVRRLDESACGLLDETLLALVSTPADELRSRQAHRLLEREVERVRLRRGADEQLYVRDGGRWRPHGLALEAPTAFVDLLDPLLGLRVERWLGPEESAGFESAVELELAGSSGAPVRFALGRANGAAACRLESGAVGGVSAELLASVLGLFEAG